MMRIAPATAAKYLAFARGSTAFRYAAPQTQRRLACVRMMSAIPSVKVSNVMCGIVHVARRSLNRSKMKLVIFISNDSKRSFSHAH
jgi:hypothetical protein